MINNSARSNIIPTKQHKKRQSPLRFFALLFTLRSLREPALIVGLAICHITLLSFYIAPNSYEGDDMLVILGANKDSRLFEDFRNFWQLDRKNENAAWGIKVFVNEKTGFIQGILLAGADTVLYARKFSKCPFQLPFGLTFNNDTVLLHSKLGKDLSVSGNNAYKFCQKDIITEATYGDSANSRIVLLKFSAAPKAAKIAISETTKPAPTGKNKIAEQRKLLEQGFAMPPYKKTKSHIVIKGSEFKKAILSVFDAWQQSGFKAIKTTARKERNFWNYKFTYNTSLKIPGEKYNMLYSFPFITTQLDFVSVLKEADTYDKSFGKTYTVLEKELTDNFPISDGWVSSCISSPGKVKLATLEFRNDNYGAIILDYSKNPKGRHILYLRFLLFSS
jgi:hypothetical protein